MVTWTAVPPQRFQLLTGRELLRRYSSSPQVAWEFCSVCGSGLFYHSSQQPDKIYVAVACLDSIDRPVDSHVSFEEHAHWLHLERSLPCYEGKSETPFPVGRSFELRPIEGQDLPALFHHQQDAQAYAMAGRPPRDWSDFLQHWNKVLADPGVTQSALLVDERVAGYLVCWTQGEQRLVGYWLGREYWGKGFASRALTLFLDLVEHRPLWAQVASGNRASQRVLEKCGFQPVPSLREDEFLFCLLAPE
jgi:RimJ/RimL family protein N-acetyltransferase